MTSTSGCRSLRRRRSEPFAAAIASSPEPVSVSAKTRHARGVCVGVRAACELGAAQLDPPFGLADGKYALP